MAMLGHRKKGMRRMSYDKRCYDLAEVFLADHPEINDEVRRQDLAQDIQDEIEAWLSAELADKKHHVGEGNPDLGYGGRRDA